LRATSSRKTDQPDRREVPSVLPATERSRKANGAQNFITNAVDSDGYDNGRLDSEPQRQNKFS
jgi:hypothetical protein